MPNHVTLEPVTSRDLAPVLRLTAIDWLYSVPFVALHAACLLVFVVGVSPIAVAVGAALYLIRMFAITAFYHRYFSHRAFKASRGWQLLFAVLGNSTVQKGPLWWAAHHRYHHRFADREGDIHSPDRHGFFWSHMGWFMSRTSLATRSEMVPDLARFPELRILDRHHILVPALLALGVYMLGDTLSRQAPGLGTSGPQMLVWGFFISTIAVYHASFTINSLSHRFGSRRFPTRDTSRNNAALAVLTFGEGWHNNHHQYPNSARQGFFWWEVDVTYYILFLLERLGIIRDLRPVPERMLKPVVKQTGG